LDNELSETTSLEFKEVRNAAVTSSAVVEAKREVVLKPGFEVKASETLSYSTKIKASAIASDDYAVYGIDYDANGNIKFLNRNKDKFNNNNLMDKLGYVYKTDKPNQLLRVTDAVTTETDADDIKNQVLEENYEYNSIGQLVKNNEENIEYIYTASGLVSEVKRNGLSLVKFYYNDKGFRVRKESFNTQTGALQSTQYYVRDVAGSVMAIYEDATQIEVPIYGAGRLGVHRVGVGTSYELTDHLGNVRAVVTKDNPTPSIFADYYPGGMQMPNRNSLNGSYRYAYQGQFAETDPETGKPAFQLRLYDPRINRWLSPDPMGQYHSPYMAMDNRPNMSVDPTGGCTVGVDCPAEFDWMGSGTWVMDDVNVGGGTDVQWGTASITGGGLIDFSQSSVSTWDQIWSGLGSFSGDGGSMHLPGTLSNIQAWRAEKPDGFVSMVNHIGVESTYGTLENITSMFNGGKTFAGTQLQGEHRTNMAIEGFSAVTNAVLGELAVFLKSAKYMGTNAYRKFLNKNSEVFIRKSTRKLMQKQHNYRVLENPKIYKEFDFFETWNGRFSTFGKETQKK